MEKKLTTLSSIRNITFSLLGLNKNLMVLTAKWNLAGNYCLAVDLKSNLLLQIFSASSEPQEETQGFTAHREGVPLIDTSLIKCLRKLRLLLWQKTTICLSFLPSVTSLIMCHQGGPGGLPLTWYVCILHTCDQVRTPPSMSVHWFHSYYAWQRLLFGCLKRLQN